MNPRGYLINVNLELVTEECCNCGVLFGIPNTMQDLLREKPGTTFYCPNGHPQHYTGKTEAQKQRERADSLERRLANRDEDLRAARASLVATKGQLTKARKRVANGVCPCCNRSFANLQRHMAGQHPDYTQAEQ